MASRRRSARPATTHDRARHQLRRLPRVSLIPAFIRAVNITAIDEAVGSVSDTRSSPGADHPPLHPRRRRRTSWTPPDSSRSGADSIYDRRWRPHPADCAGDRAPSQRPCDAVGEHRFQALVLEPGFIWMLFLKGFETPDHAAAGTNPGALLVVGVASPPTSSSAPARRIAGHRPRRATQPGRALSSGRPASCRSSRIRSRSTRRADRMGVRRDRIGNRGRN